MGRPQAVEIWQKNQRLMVLFLVLTVYTAASRGEDPYDTHPVLPTGVFQGEPIDNREKRAVHILTPEKAAKYRPGPGDMVVANFFHEGQFWIAKIPIDGVETIYFQKDVFSRFPPAAHTQLRFQMGAGAEVRLYSQVPGQGRPKKPKLKDVIFSVEATMVQGDRYGLLTGMQGRFGYAGRVMSVDDTYFRMVYGPRNHVEQIPLQLTADQRGEILSAALRKSEAEGMGETYHTICNSCTTEAFGVIDQEVRYRWLARIGGLLDRLPITPRTYLYLRGLIPFQTWIKNTTPSLEQEFALWDAREDFKERQAQLEEQAAEEREAFLAWEAQRKKNRGSPDCGLPKLR